MMFMDDVKIWFLLISIRLTSGVSYNQPKFCSNATWNPNGIIFADNNSIGSNPSDIFITINDTIYVLNSNNKQIIVWLETGSRFVIDISPTTWYTKSIFVTEEITIYFDYLLNSICGIQRWILNSSTTISVLEASPQCYDIFIDINNNIYCSMDSQHQVIQKLSNNESNPVKIVAGTGIAGSAPNMLHYPDGIFVDTNFDLYVADSWNHRIQLFRKGQSNAVTVAGNGTLSTTITLKYPAGIILDAGRYLFIVDTGNNRIVASGPNGFRCLFGCNGSGSAADQLNVPKSMSFDKFGNIYVVDSDNNRLQKFLLITNSCNESTVSFANNITYSSTNESSIIAVKSKNGISYNRPKFDPYAVWNPNAITFADNNTVGPMPFSIFINENNTIYVAGRHINRILIWTNNSIHPTTTIYTNSMQLESLFVTSNGDIYTGVSIPMYEINKWTSNTNDSAVVAYAEDCYGLFIDINNTLYFSFHDGHKVVSKSLSSTSNILTIVAGTGCNGSATNMLNTPHGIFVNINFDLYVADTFNNRVQLFLLGKLDAFTVAGNGSTNITITLNKPTSVVLDDDKYLFIADYGNNRIVGSGPYGFRCIVGCIGSSGSTSNTLSNPTTMAFDSYGNIYVADENNNRIQKFLLLNYTLVPSYNQPKFCSNATWNPNATTFANNNTIGSNPYALYIDTNNIKYAGNQNKRQILIWLNDTPTPSITIYGNLSSQRSIFVTSEGDTYVDNYYSVNRLVKSISYTNISIPVMNINSSCMGLFVDISNSLYCSINNQHQVFKKWLNDNISIVTTVAGNGSAGLTSNMLNSPNGIFVDTNFDLYVADWYNHRIQLFRLGELSGITVAGQTSVNITITLSFPSNVILDGNKYLFITDTRNNRIIGSDENGFRCIVGCTKLAGSMSNELNYPRSIAFDSLGNLYVADRNNSRIQKFLFLGTLCNEITTQQSTTIEKTTKQVSSVPDLTTLPTYFLSNCSDQNAMGIYCNISSNPCDTLQPCQNNGTCSNITTNTIGYICECLPGFNGTQCQYDYRPCKPTTCWNNGKCNTTYKCQCQPGWTGDHCELMINYCENIRCENQGVCRRLFMNYTCDCVDENLSGRHCEIVAIKLVILKYVTKSVGYIAIIVLVCTVAFIVIMDILKYCFGIDLTKNDLERIRRVKAIQRAQKRRQRPVVQKFKYVNTPPTEQQSKV